MSKTIRGA